MEERIYKTDRYSYLPRATGRQRMSYELDPEQRKRIEKEYKRGREAIVIFVALSVVIVATFVLTLIFV